MPGATTRLHGDPRACPTGCGRTVREGKLLCAPCWSRVPDPLKAAVGRTWRTWLGEGMTDDQWAAYLDARAAALAAIRR